MSISRIFRAHKGGVKLLACMLVTAALPCLGPELSALENQRQQHFVPAEIDPADPLELDLFDASKCGDLEAIVACAEAGFDLNRQDARHGVIPLAWAAAMGHAAAIDLLSIQGADVNGRNPDGATALHVACFFGRPKAAQQLLDLGADPNAKTFEGATPLDVTKADWDVTREIAQFLEIDLDEERVAVGRAEAAKLLVERGAEDGGNTLFVLSIVFGSIAGGLTIVGIVIWLVVHFEKKRSEAMRAVAAEIGLDFSPTKDEALLSKLGRFSLFNKGHSRKMKNVMKAETEIAQLTIFDYQYTTGGGKHSHTHRHTVVAMESDALSMPEFTLRPEGFFDRIGASLGFQDIDFEDAPEFSRLYVLKGKNEEAIRHFFDTEMLSMFTQRKDTTIDCSPGIFVYLRGGRKKPDEIKDFMTEGFAVYRAFEQRCKPAL